MSFSCEPKDLLTGAKCILQCVSPGMQPSAQTALLDLINGGASDLNVLLQQSKEYIWKVPPRYQVPLQIYLLLVVLEGQNRTVQELLQSASCMRCIPPGFHPAVHTYEMCEWNEGGESACSNPIMLDWLERIANDFMPRPSDETIDAICTFCNTLDTYGLTDKMLVVNPVIPDSIYSMRYPLIWQPANGFSPFINYGFVPGDLNVDGLTGDGISYFNTGFIPSIQWADVDSGGLSIYRATIGTEGASQIDIGCSVTADGTAFWLSTFDGNPPQNTNTYCWDGASGIIELHPNAIPGFYCATRTSANLFRLYRDTTLVDTNIAPQAGTPLPDIAVYFMASNADGTDSSVIDSTISFAAIHEGLTQSEVEDFYWAVQVLRMDLGGGWV